MTSRRDELEATVLEGGEWHRDQLAVYADELLKAGDPRGELIALDLHADMAEPPAEHVARRAELLAGLVGEVAHMPGFGCRYGFVDLAIDDNFDPLVRLGPLGRYLRSVRIDGAANTIAAAIDALRLTPRPWLTTLAIRKRRPGPSPVVTSKASAVLARMTPRLDQLDVSGHAVFASFAHPTLRALRVDCLEALLSFTNASDLLPAVVELDLRFQCSDHAYRRWTDDLWRTYLPVVQLPALRRLDLSRNESTTDYRQPAIIDAFRFLRLTPIAEQLTGLRWPSPRGERNLVNAQAALDRMTRLEVVELLWLGREPSGLRHRSAVIRERELQPSWQSADVRQRVTFVVAGQGIEVRLAEAGAWMDRHYEAMRPDVRAAWDYLWQVLLREPRRGAAAVFAELLARALVACNGAVWPALHRAVIAHDHGPGVMVPVF